MNARGRARLCVCVCVLARAFTSYCLPVFGIVRIGSVRFTTNVIQPAHSFTNGFLSAMDLFFFSFFLITCITCNTVFSYLILYLAFPSLCYFAFLSSNIWKMLVLFFAVPCHAGSKKISIMVRFCSTPISFPCT